MIASILVIVFSIILLLYWFRCTCLLLLRDSADEIRDVHTSVQRSFRFGDVRGRLDSETELAPLQQALSRDFQVLTYLVHHAAGLELASFEERLLVWDYRLMRIWYALTQVAAPQQARCALREMTSIISILAGRIGQRAGLQPQA